MRARLANQLRHIAGFMYRQTSFVYFAVFQANRRAADPATTNGSHLPASTGTSYGDEIPIAQILVCDETSVCTLAYTRKGGSL